jgi:NAD(P)-dependent dehydrogenase (short-subunit alcohol dehydrogenase family)
MTEAELEKCLELLERLAADPDLLISIDRDLRQRLARAAGQLSRPDRHHLRGVQKALRRRDRREERERDQALLDKTGMRKGQRAPLFVAPQPALPAAEPELLIQPRPCYVCKEGFHKLHFFYDAMCPPCAELNWTKRFQAVSLEGKWALITGARVKIGYQTSLMLLRAGAHVIVTTRFANDAARRYAREEDFASFRDRLQIHGLDLRHAPSVELFADFVSKTAPRLDILINNAAQTVRRPSAFYRHLLEGESTAPPREAAPLLAAHAELKHSLEGSRAVEGPGIVAWQAGAAGVGLLSPAALTQVPLTPDDVGLSDESFPMGHIDQDLQQIDLRPMNSWRMPAAEVPTPELLEVHLVNAIAPFLLAVRLRPLMARDRTDEKHIVNVSAMEAQFSRKKKSERHPHTNMAKAALNMLTRTSAVDFLKDGIHMNSVDTGWVTDEDPMHHVERKQRIHDFHPPLDIIDGAARVCDPFFAGLLSGEHAWGQFFKDYRPTGW